MAQASVATASATRQLVIFELGGAEYALAIERVQEIIRYSEPRSLSSPDPAVRGVISLRGAIVPVCDLAGRLGCGAEQPPAPKIVIVDARGGTAGMIVDEVAEVRTVTSDALERLPAAGDPMIEAVAKLDGRLVVLLDPDEVFRGLELAA